MIRFRALGPIELTGHEGRPLLSVLSQPRRLALFAYLALARPAGFQRRDTLVRVFWPEADAEHARDALSQALRFLRRSLGDEAIPGRGMEDVRVAPESVWCDVDALESALDGGREDEALELYRGELLEGFNVGDAPEFERWLDGERARLRERMARAAIARAERAAAEGNPAGAATWSRQAAVRRPFDEALHRRVLEYLDAAGDRAGALQEHEAFRRRLRQELESEPAPETMALVQAIRRRQAAPPATSALAEWRPPMPAAPATVRPPLDNGASSPPPAPVQTPHARLSGPARRWIWAALALSTLAAAAAGGFAVWRSRAVASALSAPATTGAGPDRVAVLYFRDHSPGSGERWLASAITESLIGELSKVATLVVISADGVAPFRDRPVATDSVGRVLGIGTLVTGALMMEHPGMVRVSVQVVDAASARVLDSRLIEAPAGQPFRLMDRVVREVSTGLRQRIGTEVELRQWRAGTRSERAWELLQRASQARADATLLMDAGDFPGAIRGLQRADSALALAERADPAWSEPTALRARIAQNLAYVALGPWPGRNPDAGLAALQAGMRQATRVLRRHPDDAAALEVRGVLGYWLDYYRDSTAPVEDEAIRRGAEDDLLKAVRLDPHRAQAWSVLSAFRMDRLDWGRAESYARHALEEDAYARDARANLWRAYRSAFELGEDARAREACEELRRRSPGEGPATICALQLMAWSASTPDVAVATALRRAADRPDAPQIDAFNRRTIDLTLAAVLARAGLSDSAEAMIARAHVSEPPPLFPREAEVRILLHQPAAAIRLLEAYLREYPGQRAAVAVERTFAPLRARSDFARLTSPAAQR